MFAYTKERELHEHIIENFNDYFDFDFISSEYVITGGRIDILGRQNNVIYIIEIKRDLITNSTINQLSNYIQEMESRNPEKIIHGIAVAPEIDCQINMHSLPSNLSIRTLDNVNFIAPEQPFMKKLINYPDHIVEQVEDYRYENRLPNFSAAVMELIQKGLEASNKEEPAE